MERIGDHIGKPGVDLAVELNQGDRAVSAEREECGRAEIHVAAIAAEYVPGSGQHDKLQDRVAGKEEIIDVKPVRESHNQRPDCASAEEEFHTSHRLHPPKTPPGRK